MTKITATPMPVAVSVFLDTPRKGHSPRNWLNTTLLTREDAIKITNNSLSIVLPLLSRFHVNQTFCAARVRTVHAVAVTAGLYL